jgi:hypothetical protein
MSNPKMDIHPNQWVWFGKHMFKAQCKFEVKIECDGTRKKYV